MADCPTDWSGITLAFLTQAQLQRPDFCTVCDCPLTLDGVQIANMAYRPSLAGNVLFAAIFGVFLAAHIFLGLRYKTRGFMIAMVCGLILEIVGYVGRILMRSHMFDFNYFIIYLVCLTIGPAFFSAAIYLTLSAIIVIYVPERARFKPQTYTYIFITFDLIALVLQAAGGGIASTAGTNSAAKQGGIDAMVAGVAWQVVSLALFGFLALDYWVRVTRRDPSVHEMNPMFEQLRRRRVFQPFFLVAIFLAGIFIFVRSVFRCVELSDGFDSALANDEVTFMVLEGTMIILACVLMTVFHPGLIIGAEGWSIARRKRAPKSFEPAMRLSEL
ncbi:hypothetical protein PLIIFM63780_008239 [Purpureocillium lilacinum]|uniref:Uncharacterized protein n=2 Tax=Purpureocillium lilacinum TaxID=33203 RepID=A0A2U3EGW9_PURLI|nr:hypothetical protein Purlil1_11789 [Purpureocillium lilacinum]PWI73733.1 hypothetical protein PCL_09009 [Purpureocillium lilacinum]GJN84677.1 hypothetical protein PLIIFM63780_008239 [Purpureocillium lilacinum]